MNILFFSETHKLWYQNDFLFIQLEYIYICVDSLPGLISSPCSVSQGHIVEGDPELIDDSEFYQQLLKEFLESCDRGSSG